MINVSEDLKALYKQDSTHKNYFIVFRDKGVMLTNTDIVSESLSITESICSSGNFQVGLTEAAVCNVKVRMPDNVKGDEIFVFQTVGGYFEPEISYDARLGIQLSGEGVARLGSSFTSTNIISGLDSARFDPAANYLVFARLKYVGNPIYLYLAAPGGNLSRMIYYLPPSLFSFKNLSAWSGSVRYGIGEYVTYSGDIWESRTYDNAQRPSAAGNAWKNITRYVQIVLPLMGSNFTEYKLGVYINSDTSKYGAPVTGYATAYKIDAPVMPLGLFGIDSCRRDADSNLRDIVGYDRMNDVGLDTDVYLSKGANQYTQVGLLLDEAARNTQIVIGTNLSRENVSPLKLADADIGKTASIDPENVYEVTKQETYELDGQYRENLTTSDDRYYRQETILQEGRYYGDSAGAYFCREMQIVAGKYSEQKGGERITVYRRLKGKVCDRDGDGLPDNLTWAQAYNSILPFGERGKEKSLSVRRAWIRRETIEVMVDITAYAEGRRWRRIGYVSYRVSGSGSNWVLASSVIDPVVISGRYIAGSNAADLKGAAAATVVRGSEYTRSTKPRNSTIGPFTYEVGYYSSWDYGDTTVIDGATYNRTGAYPESSELNYYNGWSVIDVHALRGTVRYFRYCTYGYYFEKPAGFGFNLIRQAPPAGSNVLRMSNNTWVVTGNSSEANKYKSGWITTEGGPIYDSCYAEVYNLSFAYGYDFEAPDAREAGCSEWTSSAAYEFEVSEDAGSGIRRWPEGVGATNYLYTKGVDVRLRRKRYFRTRQWNYSIPSPDGTRFGSGWNVALPSTEGKTAVMGNRTGSRYYADTKYNYSIRGDWGNQIPGSGGAYEWQDRSTGAAYTEADFMRLTAVGRYRAGRTYEYLGRIYNRTVTYTYSFDITRLPYPYRAWAFDRTQREGSYNRKDSYGNYNKSGDARKYTRQQIGTDTNVVYHRTDVYAAKWRDYARRTLYYWRERALYRRTDYAIPEGVYNTELAYTVYLTYANDLRVFRDEKSRLEALISGLLPEGESEDGRQTFKGEWTLNNRERFVEKAAAETTSEAEVRPGSYFIGRAPYSGGLFSLTWIRAIQFDGYVQYPGDSTGSRDSSLSGTIYEEKSPFLYCIAHSKAEKFNGEQIKWSGGAGADGDTKHAKRRDVVNGFLNLHGMFINFDRWGVSTIRKVKASGLYPAEDLFPHDGKYTADGETFPLLAYGDIYPSEGASETADASLCKSLYIEDETNNDFDGIYIAKPSVAEEEKKLYPFYYNTLRRRYGTLPRGMKETGYWESNNYFKIESNFYFNNFIFTEAQLKKICAFIIENVGQLKYYNLDAELRALPYLEVGDNIGIQTRDSGYETAILRRTMKGNMAQMDNIETDFYS